MNKIAFLLPVLAVSTLGLAACGQQPAPEPAPTETAPADPVSTLPAPDTSHFSDAFDAACKGAKKVNQASCKRAGMGSENVVCDYSLGDDEYMRDKATMSPNADRTGWVLTEADTVCAAHGGTPNETPASESQ